MQFAISASALTIFASSGSTLTAIALVAVSLLADLPEANGQASDFGFVATLKSQYRRPPPRPMDNQALVDLSADLFFDPALSASGKTACVTCHLPHLGWAVLLKQRVRNDFGKLTSRRSQTLARHRLCRGGAQSAGTGAVRRWKRRPSLR